MDECFLTHRAAGSFEPWQPQNKRQIFPTDYSRDDLIEYVTLVGSEAFRADETIRQLQAQIRELRTQLRAARSRFRSA